tara:strand:- start:1380 stop:2117 length:738 start_codon:yes stop_codon:yes gene_type:complete
MSTIQGQFEAGSLIPVSNVTWADLTDSPYGSWDNWTAWDGGVPKDITITTDSLDFGRVDNINVELEIEATGAVTSSIQHSEDDTTYTTATVSSSVVQGFSARFVRAVISVSGANARIDKIFASISNDTQQEQIQTNTTALQGTSTAREVDLRKSYSKVIGITGLAQASGAYVATDYVDTGYFETGEALFISVTNIDAEDSAGELAPTIAVYDKDGNTEDATVFLTVTGLPQMVQDTDGNIKIQRG